MLNKELVFKNDFEMKLEDYKNIDWTGSHAYCFDKFGKVAIVWEQGKGYWCLPGGGKEVGESPEETLRREIWEETQCEATDIKYFHAVKGEQGCNFRFICKLENIKEFVPRKNGSEIDQRIFVSLEELPNYITWLRDSENGRESYGRLKELVGQI